MAATPTPISVKNRKDLHLMRKIWHALPGVGIAIVYFLYIETEYLASMIVLAFTGFFVIVDILRLWFAIPFFIELFKKIARPLLRDYELTNVNGTTWYMVGCSIAICFFPKYIAIASILILSLADPASSLFGILFGDIKALNFGLNRFSNGKSVIGLLAGAIVGTLAAMGTVFVFCPNVSTSSLAVTGLLAGLSAAIGETFDILSIDDNVILPFVAATTLYISSVIFPITECVLYNPNSSSNFLFSFTNVISLINGGPDSINKPQ